MAKYPKVPQAKITSLPIVSLAGGLDQRGAANAAPNTFTVGTNTMVNLQGLATHRLGLKRWLPDAVGTVYEVFTTDYNDVITHFIADNGKIRYCHEGDTTWTNCGGDSVTTTGVVTTFLQVVNKVLILNGTDNLGYVDLTTMNVVHFAHVNSPTSAPTAAVSAGITGTAQKVYYCIWYSGIAGTTASSPILTQQVGKIREQWVASTDGVTITDPNTRPTGATKWNIGLAQAIQGGTPQPSDLLPIAVGLDLAVTTFVDNGSITPLTNMGTAPDVNTTDGPKAKYGQEIDGRPFLYNITGDEYAVMIGGDGDNALDFTPGNGGYRLLLNQGTDFKPSAIVGFRNGQSTPSITVLYSSVSGLSKSSIIEQNSVSLGTYSATVWGSTDQNYGSAGVAAPYAVMNYRGTLIFPSVDGITTIDTSRLRFNVLTATRISDPIIDEIGSIKTENLSNIVGAAYANRIMFAAATEGFDSNNKILVYDVTNADNPCWYTFDIAAQWIGVVSPPSTNGFVYVCQGNHFFKLEEAYVAQDELPNGLTQPFEMQTTSALIGANAAKDGFFAVVQAVFYLENFIGNATLIVSWRDYQSGKMKSKTKVVSNGAYTNSSVGNWSSSGYEYNYIFPTIANAWSGVDYISGANSSRKDNIRARVNLNNVITNELQATVAINPDSSSLIWRSASFQGQPLGISPDVRG